MHWYKIAVSRMPVPEALQVFGFSPDDRPSSLELKQRYRSLAMQNHGDVGGKDQDMIRINNAYETLKSTNFATYRPSGPAMSGGWDSGGASYDEDDGAPWQTDSRASYNGISKHNFTDKNFCLKSIYEKAIEHGDVQKVTFWAFDGNFFRGVFTAFANEPTLGFGGEVMAYWNSNGSNSYPTEAVLVNKGDRMQVVWLKGQDVASKNITIEHESFNSNPSNDPHFMERLKKVIRGSSVDTYA